MPGIVIGCAIENNIKIYNSVVSIVTTELYILQEDISPDGSNSLSTYTNKMEGRRSDPPFCLSVDGKSVSNVVYEYFGDFLVITRIEALNHTENDTGTTVVVEQELSGLLVKGQTFDLTLEGNIIKGSLENYSCIGCTRADIYTIEMVWLDLISSTIISSQIEGTLEVSHTLYPLRWWLDMNLAEILTSLQVILIEITAGLFTYPRAHPHGLSIWVNSDTGALFLARGWLEWEGSLQFQAVTIMNSNLDVFTNTIHEVLGTYIDFVLIYVDITNMVGWNLVAIKWSLVDLYLIPTSVILSESLGTRNPEIVTLRSNTLTAFYLMNGSELIGVLW